MTNDQTHIIVGASLAGAKAAETLRAEGFDGRVVLVGAEAERPYERPPLSKDYLRGEVGREKVYVHVEGFYSEHDIELRLGTTAVDLNTSTSELTLDDGDLEAALAGRGSDLGTDPTRPDHDDGTTAVKPLAQEVGVVDAA